MHTNTGGGSGVPLAYLALTILCQPPHHAVNNGGGSVLALVTCKQIEQC